jgi:MFS transporter, MHS family, citrate/tricarballylate:H+ symporter
MSAPPHIKKRHIAAVVTGNALEFYDFVTYSFFSIYIGRAFFPESLTRFSLLASLATFGVGFVMRPVGAYVIGRMGDRVGRKPAMLLSFSLMGFGIAGLALTPSYTSIGLAAPILVVLFRLVQGFALGGEVGPTTAFLIEAAPPERRGLYSSLQYTTQDLSVLIAGLVGLGLANTLSEEALQDWGWRAALLIGVAIVPFGLVLRRALPETLHVRAATASPRPPVRSYRRIAMLGGIMLAAGTIATYTNGYLATYAIHDLHMSPSIAFGATVIVGLCGVVFQPLSGILSDRFGRKPVMLVPLGLLLLATLPSFALIAHFRNPAALYGATFVLASLLGLGAPACITWLTESLPTHIRSGALSLVYAISISVFGGSAQFIAAALIERTGNPLAPAWYMAGAMAVGLAAMVATRESAPVRAASALGPQVV